MSRYEVILTKQALADYERLQDFLSAHQDPLEADLLAFITTAINILEHQPGIGRPVEDGLRELIIDRGANGYLAKYSIDRAALAVRILRLRHQKEISYPVKKY